MWIFCQPFSVLVYGILTQFKTNTEVLYLPELIENYFNKGFRLKFASSKIQGWLKSESPELDPSEETIFRPKEEWIRAKDVSSNRTNLYFLYESSLVPNGLSKGYVTFSTFQLTDGSVQEVFLYFNKSTITKPFLCTLTKPLKEPTFYWKCELLICPMACYVRTKYLLIKFNHDCAVLKEKALKYFSSKLRS